MSHAIDLDGIREKLFVLRHLALGTKEYCRVEEITSEVELSGDFFNDYWGQLKVLLSNYLIEIAVKIRMIEEYCLKNGYKDEIRTFEKEATSGLALGKIHSGSFSLSIRESSNKIIHATRAYFEFKKFKHNSEELQCWNGNYNFEGHKNGKEWHFELYIDNWCNALTEYLNHLEESEFTIEIGQDYA